MEREGITKSKKGKTSAIKAKKSIIQEKGIKKQYLKSRPVCNVTFRLPKEAALDAQKVTIVGEFNNWDRDATPMKRLKNGDWTVTIYLESSRDYRYRYLIDGNRWENDWFADRYEPNPYGCDDSIVSV